MARVTTYDDQAGALVDATRPAVTLRSWLPPLARLLTGVRPWWRCRPLNGKTFDDGRTVAQLTDNLIAQVSAT